MRQRERGGRCRLRSLGAWPGGSAGAHRSLPVPDGVAGTRVARDGVRPGPPDAYSWHPATRSARSSRCPSSTTASRHGGADAGCFRPTRIAQCGRLAPQPAHVTAVGAALEHRLCAAAAAHSRQLCTLPCSRGLGELPTHGNRPGSRRLWLWDRLMRVRCGCRPDMQTLSRYG